MAEPPVMLNADANMMKHAACKHHSRWHGNICCEEQWVQMSLSPWPGFQENQLKGLGTTQDLLTSAVPLTVVV